MNAQMTTETEYAAGDEAPRGTYICLSSGMVHRLSRPACLPEGGPFRQVAPTDTLGAHLPSLLAGGGAPRTGAGIPPALAPAIVEALTAAEERAQHPVLRWPEDENGPPVEEAPGGWLQMLALYHLGRSGRLW